jgi:hypothetical protein
MFLVAATTGNLFSKVAPGLLLGVSLMLCAVGFWLLTLATPTGAGSAHSGNKQQGW